MISLQQQKCCETWWLSIVFHDAISNATCLATKLRDRLQDKLDIATASLIVRRHFTLAFLREPMNEFSVDSGSWQI